MSESAEITENMRQKARELNIDLIGAIPSELMDEFAGMEVNWDRWGTMKSPRDYLPDARSVVVVAEAAFGPTIDLAVRRRGGWNYVGYKPLELDTWEIGSYLQSLGYQAEVFPSHLSQKNMARLAGMGSFGKNTLLLNPDVGPYLRIDGIVTDAPLEYDEPAEADLCGSCERCLQACPTGALQPFEIEAEKCLVHQRLQGPDDVRYAGLLEQYSPRLASGAYLMCQRCQQVCPVGGIPPWERDGTTDRVSH